MARGLGRGGRPLGSGREDNDSNGAESQQPTPEQIVKHNGAVKAIEWARNPQNPAYNSPESDTIVRAVSENLINGSMQQM